MASRPVFRDEICNNLLEQIHAQRRVSPLILSIEQARRCCCGRQPAQLGANPAPALKSGYFDRTKSGVFVTSVAFALHYWN
ncbi:hypothetical protein Y032_1043g3479 [Ancylostoma ceylanicum]|uniref:Uncharacterized protein n=1 Tax=Ancylostoma ceylanicum TaxID=53326 RepID=A0A016W775_9BILA|nr:hypothetical protein Y032_1043g3479 [Ancylostoma ceylanicum]